MDAKTNYNVMKGIEQTELPHMKAPPSNYSDCIFSLECKRHQLNPKNTEVQNQKREPCQTMLSQFVPFLPWLSFDSHPTPNIYVISSSTCNQMIPASFSSSLYNAHADRNLLIFSSVGPLPFFVYI